MIPGIRIEPEAPPGAGNALRSDVACFIGYVARRRAPGGYTRIPKALRDALDRAGWLAGPYQRAADVETLLDLPVPIDGIEIFEQLFDGDARDAGDGRTRLSSYLAVAVRSFFAQGGRRCWLIRCGDPWPYLAPRAQRLARLRGDGGVPLIPGFDADDAAPVLRGSPADPANWHGATHLFGLDEVSFVCLPDLADALRVDGIAPAPVHVPPAPPEQFIECAVNALPPDDLARVQALPAPTLDADGYTQWARAQSLLCDLLARPRAGQHRRDVQLIAALPLPQAPRTTALTRETPAADPLGFLRERGWLAAAQAPGQLGSAFLQLAYPWVASSVNTRLPGGLESPDGVLAGVIARNTLLRGAYRSAAGSALIGVRRLCPQLSRAQTLRVERVGASELVLADKLSLFAPSPLGFQLASDVTMSASADWRAASVNRLLGVILRAARRVGEELMFDASGERLWRQLRERLGSLMEALWRRGALAGASSAQAYALRCDRTTMTQDDLDSGRVIATLEFTAAQPLETISISLSLSSAGVGVREHA